MPRPPKSAAPSCGNGCRFEAPFDDGRRFSLDLFEDWLAEELAALGDVPNLKPAARLLHELVTADEFEEFLTLPAYDLLARRDLSDTRPSQTLRAYGYA